ncbi:MAG: ribonuclease Z [Chitinophagia bacterium]|nr:ribonuclease Z [Chitinophagia bacterium]
MKITILGNNSALPAYGRHPTSQIVSLPGEDIMIDCGESTQVQMQRYGIRWRNLNHIFISHLHGDHYFGLPGLITTMSLQGRTAGLNLYAPARLMEIIHLMLDVANTELSFPLHFEPLPAGEAKMLQDAPAYTLSCFPVSHRIACHGLVITHKTKGRRILPEMCMRYNIPVEHYEKLRMGQPYIMPNGVFIDNNLLTADAPAPKKYAYCADTLYLPDIVPYIQNANAIYHEATYMEADKDKAILRYHSTAAQAAAIAKQAGVNKLLIGHFSSRYKDLEPLLQEAKEVFEATVIAEEGGVYEL